MLKVTDAAVCCRQLPYLEAVVLETLRLRPPAYIVGRCAAEGDELAGFHVQAGDHCTPALQAARQIASGHDCLHAYVEVRLELGLTL